MSSMRTIQMMARDRGMQRAMAGRAQAEPPRPATMPTHSAMFEAPQSNNGVPVNPRQPTGRPTVNGMLMRILGKRGGPGG